MAEQESRRSNELWVGHEQEAEDFLKIVQSNCACQYDPGHGALIDECLLHRDLRNNPRLISGLLFAKAQHERFEREEKTNMLLWKTRVQ